jgi:hypothetical protein
MNASLLALMLPLTVAAPEPGPEPPGGGKYYKTPQAVFDASEKAVQKKDYKAVVACIAPEGRKELAAELAAQAVAVLGVKVAAGEKALKPMRAVLARHGLTAKAVSGITVYPADAASMQKARAALGKLIKKPEAFAVEMMAAQEKYGEATGTTTTPRSTLESVKVEGKKASGTLLSAYCGAFRVKYQISFVKDPNGWRMLPVLSETALDTEGPPPG